jgi:serine/threonine-protein kinase
VYEAAHRRLRNKRFAIKVLHLEMTRQPEVVSRFQREAEASSVLTHPNVVDVCDVNRTPDGRPYIVAELLEGEDLGHYLEKHGRLAQIPALRILRQLCHALSAAHARGIVHRDIKPENVFLVGALNAPRVKVLDFGISKVGDGKNTLTKTGVIMGTPAYMPPEQARGSHVDHRADIYAVGAILYRMLTGQKPFEDGDPVATLTAVLSDEPRRPSTIERSIPPALELVIQKAMAKDAAERYPTLAALEAELLPFDPEGAALFPDVAAPTLAGSDNPRAEGTAHTVLDPSTLRHAASQAGDAQQAQGARSSVVLLTAASIVWLLVGLIDAISSAVAWLEGAEQLTQTEVTLSFASAIAVLMTPSALWIRHLTQKVWPSTPRSIETAQRLRRTLLTSLALYAIGTVAVHAFATLVHRDPRAAASPGWAVCVFALAWLGAAASWFLGGRRMRA